MLTPLAQVLGGVPFKYFGDWTDRVARGELPHAKPPRPQGVERSIVVTTWEWGDPKKYLHDLIASDRRYPTVNAYGKLYGSPEYATDEYPILDPRTHTVTTFTAPVRDPDTPEALGPGHAALEKPMAPSPYWGEEKIWDTKANNHNGMFDRKGRVWFAAAVRGPDNPAFCKKGSDHPSARLFPLERTQPLAHVPRAEDDEVHVRRHVLPDASPAVRLRRQRHPVDQRRGSGGRLGQHARCSTRRATPPDRRAGRRSSSTPTATASATSTSSPTSRSIRPRTSASPAASTPSCRARSTGRSGARSACSAAPRRRSCGSLRDRTRRRPRSRRSTTCRSRTSASAAPTSTGRASCGRRWAAATSAASTGASARGRSTARRPPAIIARRAGPSTSTPGRASRASARTAPSRATTRWVDQHNTFGLGEDVPMSTANLNDGLVALKDGKMILLARAVPARLLRQGVRRAHRRPERRLEGPRAVDDQRRPDAVAHGRRQGEAAHRRALPAPPRSARALTTHGRALANDSTRLFERLARSLRVGRSNRVPSWRRRRDLIHRALVSSRA